MRVLITDLTKDLLSTRLQFICFIEEVLIPEDCDPGPHLFCLSFVLRTVFMTNRTLWIFIYRSQLCCLWCDCSLQSSSTSTLTLLYRILMHLCSSCIITSVHSVHDIQYRSIQFSFFINLVHTTPLKTSKASTVKRGAVRPMRGQIYSHVTCMNTRWSAFKCCAVKVNQTNEKMQHCHNLSVLERTKRPLFRTVLSK